VPNVGLALDTGSLDSAPGGYVIPSRWECAMRRSAAIPLALPTAQCPSKEVENALTPALCNRLLRLAAFENPEFHRAQWMRLPTYDTPRIIGCAEDHPLHIGLPRGCLEDPPREKASDDEGSER
jgi:hypothetical protein